MRLHDFEMVLSVLVDYTQTGILTITGHDDDE